MGGWFLAGNSFYCRPRTASDTTCKLALVLLSPTSQKISTWKNLARVAAEEQNGPGVRESPEKAVPTRRKLLFVVFAT